MSWIFENMIPRVVPRLAQCARAGPVPLRSRTSSTFDPALLFLSPQFRRCHSTHSQTTMVQPRNVLLKPKPDAHTHSHSHSIFHSHSHSHGEDSAVQDGDKIIAALKGSGDRGAYITLVGLASNIVLTGVKAAAGWYMHSASLLADAGHSLSDLLGDIVVLVCWKLSRKPPSIKYPYGFAKFEAVGTSIVSLLLIGGALGIGFHSYHLLMHTIHEILPTLSPGLWYDFLKVISSTSDIVPHIGHAHVHAVDPNAAWFALVSIAAKEWLYRITKVVADDERSPVLLANAIHHRSDAYSSAVAFFAILGTWMFPAIPLDPIGGFLVSTVILTQGWGLLHGAWGDLTDAGLSTRTEHALLEVLNPLVHSDGTATSAATLLGIENLRGRRAGSLMFIDLTAVVPGSATVAQSQALEDKIKKTLTSARKEIKEVTVTFKADEKHLSS